MNNASLYDHDQEEVHPWYHKVWLEDSNIEADWTTTERAVIYRFKYTSKDSNNVIFRSGRKASFKVVGNNVIQGWEEFEKTRQCQVIETVKLLKKKRPELDIEVVDPYNFFRMYKGVLLKDEHAKLNKSK